ncbi:MAG: hypothetical protein DRI61_01795 [Chloroflexi bacterium]|nr:MAG: hypothetical protein DRI61_01795 [Chloroflexota bacterium]HDN79577.1 hypothetical protein [Chloroflexota bacterium]
MALKPVCKIGIDGNRPIEADGCLAPQMADPRIIAETGACFVRLNFVLGPWDSPRDSSHYCHHTWFEAFDAIVDGLLEQGVHIYGLIGIEAVAPPGPGDNFRAKNPNPKAEEWIRRYVNNFRAIVEHFHNRVWAFELINEPNDWYGGTCSLFHPYWMARIQKEIYTAVKEDFDVLIVSGPILAHDLPTGRDTGADYLRGIYRYGIEELGWDEVKEQMGTYPLDGVAYHLYVGQVRDAPLDYTLNTVKSYINEIWGVITTYEGEDTQKRLYISEAGWPSDQGEDFQAANMQAVFRYFIQDDRVAGASWFCLRDFPGVSRGLYRPEGLGPAQRKRAYYEFQRITRLAKQVATVEVPEGVPASVGRDAAGNIYQPIIDCYIRNGGQEKLGLPFDNGGGVPVHRWGKGWVQDFQTPDGTLKSIIMLRDGSDTAYILWGVIREHYIYKKGGAEGPLGYPVADQTTDEWGLPKGAFENGVIICRPTALLK